MMTATMTFRDQDTPGVSTLWGSSLLDDLEEVESRSLEPSHEPDSHAKGREAQQVQREVGVPCVCSGPSVVWGCRTSNHHLSVKVLFICVCVSIYTQC